RLPQIYTQGVYQQIPALNTLVKATTADDITLLTVQTDAVVGSNDEQALLKQLRSIPTNEKQDLRVLVGGPRAIGVDFTNALYEQSLHPLLFILLTTFVALLFTFRSLLLALKAVLMNLLSIGAAYGGLVFVFQQGHFGRFLGFTATGSID